MTANGAQTMPETPNELAEIKKQLETERAARKREQKQHAEALAAQGAELATQRETAAEMQRLASDRGFALERFVAEANERLAAAAAAQAAQPAGEVAGDVSASQLAEAITLLVELSAKVEQHTNACARALVLIERAQTLQLQIASATFERTAERG